MHDTQARHIANGGENVGAMRIRAVATLGDQRARAHAHEEIADLSDRMIPMQGGTADIAVTRTGEQQDGSFKPAR